VKSGRKRQSGWSLVGRISKLRFGYAEKFSNGYRAYSVFSACIGRTGNKVLKCPLFAWARNEKAAFITHEKRLCAV